MDKYNRDYLIQIAKVCHEANKAFCETNGDDSQKSWIDAEEWQVDSVIDGVIHALDNPAVGPRQSHQNWYNKKKQEGWVFGEEKNTDEKTHPCMVSYSSLPDFQRKKDALFLAVIRSLA